MGGFDDKTNPAASVQPVEKGDAVFGVQGEGHVHYTSMGWIKAAFVLLKTQIALGVLAMPTALLAIGGVPGTLVIFGMGLLTTWSDWVVGDFKRHHPEVYALDDVGFVLYGRIGREFFGFSYAIFLIALVGAGLLPVSVAFNTITEHATCTVVWVVVGAIVTFCLASIQTLNRVSIISTVGFLSIMVGILTLTISVGTQERPASAPQDGPWDKGISAFKSASFLDGVSAIITAIFGLCGTPVFFGVISEMKDVRQFNKSLAMCQSIVVSTYITIGVVVWYFCGQYLSNPALGSAGRTMAKVTYGLALPGLFSSVILYCHCAAKMIFVRILRDSHHLTAHTRTHWVVWLSTVATCTFLGFLLAMTIPFFGSLVLLIGSLFGTLMCMQFSGWMWLHDHWRQRKTNPTVGFWCLAALNWFLIVFGTFLMIAGTVAAVKSIIDSYAIGAVTSPFSCADNSG